MSPVIQIAEASAISLAFSGNVEERELDALLELSGLSLSQDKIKSHLSNIFPQSLVENVMDRLLQLS